MKQKQIEIQNRNNLALHLLSCKIKPLLYYLFLLDTDEKKKNSLFGFEEMYDEEIRNRNEYKTKQKKNNQKHLLVWDIFLKEQPCVCV